MLSDYEEGSLLPDHTDPYPVITLAPDLKDCFGLLLTDPAGVTLSDTAGMLDRLLVKGMNKKTLNGRSDTPWRSLYKLPLTKTYSGGSFTR